MSYIGALPTTAEYYYDVFDGDGLTNIFNTTIAPATPVSVIVTVDGSIVDPQDYYFIGNTVTFANAPLPGTRNIQLRYLAIPASGVAAPYTYRQVNEFTAYAGQTVFNCSQYDLTYVDVYVNGVQLGNLDFQASDGYTVVIQVPCRAGDFVRIVSAYNTVLTRNYDYEARANIAIIQGVDVTQNTYTQSAFDFANTRYSSSGGTINGNVIVTGNVTPTNNNTNYLGSSSNRWHSLYVGPGSIDIGGTVLSVTNSSLIVTGGGSSINVSALQANTLYAQGVNDGQNTSIGIVQGGLNTANANIYTLFAIDTAQNTNISAASTLAQNAYNAANTASNASSANTLYIQGIDNTQNTNINIVQGGLNTANANITYILGVDVTQNTNITAADTKAQNAWNAANSAASSSIDSFARTTANNAQANTIYTQGVDTTQNTNITAADTKASNAQANTIYTQGVDATQNTNITNLTTSVGNKVASITGTTNQITVTGTTTPTLSLPQSIATTSNVQFYSFGVGTAGSGTSGEIRATNNITAYYSDDRLKTRLGNIENALDKLKSLNGFYYEANQTAQDLGYTVHKEVGLSAQEVQNVLPEIVVPAPIDERYLTIHYERMIPLLVEAIKELSEEIQQLKAKQ